MEVNMNTKQIHSKPVINYGWVCPKCGAAMAPSERVCINCKGQSQVTISVVPYIPGQSSFN